MNRRERRDLEIPTSKNIDFHHEGHEEHEGNFKSELFLITICHKQIDFFMNFMLFMVIFFFDLCLSVFIRVPS